MVRLFAKIANISRGNRLGRKYTVAVRVEEIGVNIRWTNLYEFG